MKCWKSLCFVLGVAVLLAAPDVTMGCLSACCEGSTCTQKEVPGPFCCPEFECCGECTEGICVSDFCTSPQACCIGCPGAHCRCVTRDPICCVAQGGTVQTGTCPFNCVTAMARDDEDEAVLSSADPLPTEPAEDCDEDPPQQAEPASKKSVEPTVSGFGILITALLFTALVPMLVGLRRFMVHREKR